MITVIALGVAAICGARNFHLNDKYRADAARRDAAAKWGVAAAAASWGAILSFAFGAVA